MALFLVYRQSSISPFAAFTAHRNWALYGFDRFSALRRCCYKI
ncbi:hypothetical protein KPSA3_03214 [Pseudomonas syringae pv. actinidiae]|uniref:Uncharacterized protein n=1 Tax=Pseudomonas syringae pv. actinidiae TaxID=103796 RepID=A0AAN4TL44_PSESF|nr:hypothetical protein KPSA3_03214 [Pseudomonas syringae pv. actinidiae]